MSLISTHWIQEDGGCVDVGGTGRTAGSSQESDGGSARDGRRVRGSHYMVCAQT